MQDNRLKIDTSIKFPEEITKKSKKAVHFIALGGIGMSGLAKFLLELGYKVSGSDIKDGPTMFSISAHGGTVFVGHNAENLGNAGLVIVSSAIKESNPEVIEARKRNIPIMHRSQLLEAIMSGLGLEKDKKQTTIGVSGTHGKTTTTGMISLVFEDAELNPSVVVGGQMPYLNTNSKLGSGKFFIAELDESDGTIELYAPDISVIANLELDHPDHYVDGIEQLFNTFERYISRLKEGSKIVLNADCPGNRELLSRINHPGVILYSINENCELFSKADYIARNIHHRGLNSYAEIYKNNEFIGKLELSVPGIHNVSNALATIVTALESGISFEKAAASVKRFIGMKRRFQILGTANSARIVDDYAHHPTELEATLKSAREVVDSEGAGRVIAIFQPHRYSRLSNFWNEFAESLKIADIAYVCDVYAASEKPIEGINSERFVQDTNLPNVQYVSGPVEKLPDIICSEIRPNDIVLTIGAGDITKLGHMMVAKMGLDKVTIA